MWRIDSGQRGAVAGRRGDGDLGGGDPGGDPDGDRGTDVGNRRPDLAGRSAELRRGRAAAARSGLARALRARCTWRWCSPTSGARTCELRGFPGVSYVAGDDGHQVGPAAAMSGPRGGEVVLKPGAAAAAQLQLVNVANFDAAVCRPTPVRGLRVYPPGDTTSLYVERAGTGCAGAPPGNQLSVQTLTPAPR